jgi:hypothetical protein
MARQRKGDHLRLVTDGEELGNDDQNAHLYGAGGGGGPMDPISPKDYTDARVAELRAESRAVLADIKSFIDSRMIRIDRLPTLWQLVSAVAAGFVATVTLILAVMAYTGDRVDTTAQTAAALGASTQRLEAATQANAKALQDLREDQNRDAPRK